MSAILHYFGFCQAIEPNILQSADSVCNRNLPYFYKLTIFAFCHCVYSSVYQQILVQVLNRAR